MQQIPGSRTNPNLVLCLYFALKSIPMFFSGMSIYLGYKLFILGVTGQASLSVESNTVSGQLINAAPGLFFSIGGIICLIFSVLKGVKIDFNNGHDQFLSNAAPSGRYRGG